MKTIDPRPTPPEVTTPASAEVKMIAGLFVDPRGAYAGLPDVDPWGEARDARSYSGPHPVIAHPPCSRWCQLAFVVQARYGHRVGDDGGAFWSALQSVRRWGGVLEHPAESIAWWTYGLTIPNRDGGWRRVSRAEDPRDESWVCHVEQGNYGHRARKATWLLAVGFPYGGRHGPPELRWGRSAPSATVSFMVNHGGGSLPRLSKREASATPEAFARELVGIANSCERR